MDKINYKWLTLCLFLLCAGNACGWAIARKLAGPVESIEFLYIGGIFSALIFLAQSLIFLRAKERLVFYLIFRAVSGLSLVWYMLCLVLPIFWIPYFDMISKLAVIAFSVLLFICNWREGLRTVKKCWGEKDPFVKKHYNSRQDSLDWDKIVKALHLSVSLYIPGVPRRMAPALSIVIFVLMILGLNFRKMFPVLSVFAWGIPCIIVSSTLFQMMAMNIAQAMKVIELEVEMGSKIRPAVN